jgi:hypothetical protein
LAQDVIPQFKDECKKQTTDKGTKFAADIKLTFPNYKDKAIAAEREKAITAIQQKIIEKFNGEDETKIMAAYRNFILQEDNILLLGQARSTELPSEEFIKYLEGKEAKFKGIPLIDHAPGILGYGTWKMIDVRILQTLPRLHAAACGACDKNILALAAAHALTLVPGCDSSYQQNPPFFTD